ncbi:hypothetical protein BW723_11225 [Polaribacter reichenbachii]|nr:hypothetical protein BW723_11225 [Polaribacter reichenbachii]AUC20401.1 hypothetical protein BTO17_01670 [Polaribacter reichenbachii]
MFKNIPQENIFVHYNTTFLLSGEQLLYKVYCLNAKTNQLTNLSKVAYVALIDQNYKIHFKHKILLNSGIGQGDFFIPASINSGNYKIIAYTKWMKNGGEDNFFQGDIAILNPFADNSKFLNKEKEVAQTVDKNEIINNKTNAINLKINKTIFTNREKVTLNVNADNLNQIAGNYSISVRKVNQFNVPKKKSSSTYLSLYQKKKLGNKTAQLVQFPEFRGELISGKVIHKDSKKAIPSVNVSIAIPGKEYVFKVSKTDDKGIFYFIIDKTYNSSKATIEIDDENREDYQIIMNKDDVVNFKTLKFKDFSLSEEVKKNIEQRSIYNQIENAYNVKKQDSIKKYVNKEKFFGSNVYTYYLDDYTRFPTLKETLTEITEHLYYSKKGDQYSIKVLGVDFFYRNNKPLLLIEGLQILNHNDIIDLKTRQVEKIIVLKDNYVYGTKLYNGVIILETFKGDYTNLVSKDYQKNIELFKPLVPKKYFTQKYDTNKQERIPDFRAQLFWQLDCKLSKESNTFDFYTSDNLGVYEINLEGFTNDGKPISIKTTFEVK